MATANGNNPVTGSAHATADQAKADAAKVAALAAKAEIAEAKAFDKRLMSALRSHENSTAKVAELIAQAKDGNEWRSLVDSEGNGFKTVGQYISDRLSKFPLLHKGERDARIKFLYAEGLTIREAAKAANTSVGTAANAINGAPGTDEHESKRAARPDGDTTATPDASKTAAKTVKGATAAFTRVRDHASDMSDEQIASILSEARDTVAVLEGIVKLRVMVAERNAVAVDADEHPLTPAVPTPGDVAKKVSA